MDAVGPNYLPPPSDWLGFEWSKYLVFWTILVVQYRGLAKLILGFLEFRRLFGP